MTLTVGPVKSCSQAPGIGLWHVACWEAQTGPLQWVSTTDPHPCPQCPSRASVACFLASWLLSPWAVAHRCRWSRAERVEHRHGSGRTLLDHLARRAAVTPGAGLCARRCGVALGRGPPPATPTGLEAERPPGSAVRSAARASRLPRSSPEGGRHAGPGAGGGEAEVNPPFGVPG